MNYLRAFVIDERGQLNELIDKIDWVGLDPIKKHRKISYGHIVPRGILTKVHLAFSGAGKQMHVALVSSCNTQCFAINTTVIDTYCHDATLNAALHATGDGVAGFIGAV
jgi:hypothetical protein